MNFVRSHILVCTGTGCSSSNIPKIIEAFERELKAQGMEQEAMFRSAFRMAQELFTQV